MFKSFGKFCLDLKNMSLYDSGVRTKDKFDLLCESSLSHFKMFGLAVEPRVTSPNL